ncbi:MAG TPA: hypothetical protein PK201_15655, partial [Accumulibacter sp.]|nr:hypothetical protein [Accumulibacter sp.]
LPRAAARGLLSVTLDLGAGGEQRWLDGDLARAQLNWWARPAGSGPDVAAGGDREAGQRSGAHGDYRLAVGSAMSFTSTGAARF